MKSKFEIWYHKFCWEWNNVGSPYSYKVVPLFWNNYYDQSLRLLANHLKDPENFKVKITYNEYDQITKVEKI